MIRSDEEPQSLLKLDSQNMPQFIPARKHQGENSPRTSGKNVGIPNVLVIVVYPRPALRFDHPSLRIDRAKMARKSREMDLGVLGIEVLWNIVQPSVAVGC